MSGIFTGSRADIQVLLQWSLEKQWLMLTSNESTEKSDNLNNG